jgi:hypothetical protein
MFMLRRKFCLTLGILALFLFLGSNKVFAATPKINTCDCAYGKPVRENCQGNTSVPVCVPSSTSACVCTQNGQLAGSGAPTASLNDPFAGCNPANSANPQINTALGCVPVEMGGFISWLLPKLFGVIGGISFLLIVYGFILVATSSGDPKKVEGARETITAAITGLLVSIFALFLLRLIAINILHIPGLN